MRDEGSTLGPLALLSGWLYFNKPPAGASIQRPRRPPRPPEDPAWVAATDRFAFAHGLKGAELRAQYKALSTGDCKGETTWNIFHFHRGTGNGGEPIPVDAISVWCERARQLDRPLR